MDLQARGMNSAVYEDGTVDVWVGYWREQGGLPINLAKGFRHLGLYRRTYLERDQLVIDTPNIGYANTKVETTLQCSLVVFGDFAGR